MIKIKITYDVKGDDAPHVEVEPKDTEYELHIEPNDLLFTHDGVSVYYTEWKNDCASEYWYSTRSNCDSEDYDAFDVREIPHDDSIDDDNHEAILRHAIDNGWLTEEGLELPDEEEEEES